MSKDILDSQKTSFVKLLTDYQTLYKSDSFEKMIDFYKQLVSSGIPLERMSEIQHQLSIYKSIGTNLEYQSSSLSGLDSEDVIALNDSTSPCLVDTISTQFSVPKSIAKESTSSQDINRANELFEIMLNKRTPMFIWLLKHTDFEDGVSNSSIEEVKGYLKANRYVTLIWLHSLYAQNQMDHDVLAALLRVVAMTINSDISDKLMTMVIAGLNAPSSKTQEAALTVIEVWRTPHCLDALCNRQYYSNWIAKYANEVKDELMEELKYVDKTNHKYKQVG